MSLQDRNEDQLRGDLVAATTNLLQAAMRTESDAAVIVLGERVKEILGELDRRTFGPA